MHAYRMEKRPFYFQLRDESPFAFAGIWDTWSNRGEVITSCAIITTVANELVRELHDRMPATLLQEFHDAWLDPKTDRAVLTEMLRPFSSSRMKSHPVSSAVDSQDRHTRSLAWISRQARHKVSFSIDARTGGFAPTIHSRKVSIRFHRGRVPH